MGGLSKWLLQLVELASVSLVLIPSVRFTKSLVCFLLKCSWFNAVFSFVFYAVSGVSALGVSIKRLKPITESNRINLVHSVGFRIVAVLFGFLISVFGFGFGF